MTVLTRIGKCIYQAGLGVLCVLGLLLLGLLSLSTLLVSCYAEDMETQISLPHRDPVLLQLLGILCIAGLMLLVGHCCRRNFRRCKRILLLLSGCWVMGWGIYLILAGKTTPSADAAIVYNIGGALAGNDLGVIHPTGSYLSYYPQQIGLSAFYELVLRVWNLLPTHHPAYDILKGINVFCACLILYSQYGITHLLFESDRTDILYLLLAMFHAPLIMYTSFVYGEIPSFTLFSLGTWLLLLAVLKRIRPRLLMPVGAAMLILGVALRKNTLILIIAVCIALLWEWLRTHRHSLLLCALCLMLGSLSILPAIQGIYEHRAGNTLSRGVPAMAYFAMGMQEASRGNGWYNGFNFYTYQDTGMDTEATVSISRQAIRERLDIFQKEPAYAFTFYRDKFLSQWTDGSCFCRQATLASAAERTGFLSAVYNGSLSKAFMGFCNLWQAVIYVFALFWLLWGIRRAGSSFLVYTGLTGVLGGFLFHMVWEANSRYIFPYELLLLPYAACGLHIVGLALDRAVQSCRRKLRRQP